MGRPSKQPSDEQRLQVAAWSKARVAVEEIARRIGLAPKTLRKHFAVELGLVQVETVITREFTRFVPTDEQCEQVLLLSGVKWSRNEIAQFIGVDRLVFDEHFSKQFEDGPKRFVFAKLKALSQKADLGDTRAIAMCLTMSERDRNDPENQPAALGLPGKKAQAAIAAQSAESGTRWEDIVSPGRPN